MDLIAPVSAILLGILSLGIRWLGDFKMENTGSDLSTMALSLQVNMFFSRSPEQKIGDFMIIHLDFAFFIILMILWVLSLMIIKKGRKKNLEIFNLVNVYFLIAFIMGNISLILEMYWRITYG